MEPWRWQMQMTIRATKEGGGGREARRTGAANAVKGRRRHHLRTSRGANRACVGIGRFFYLKDPTRGKHRTKTPPHRFDPVEGGLGFNTSTCDTTSPHPRSPAFAQHPLRKEERACPSSMWDGALSLSPAPRMACFLGSRHSYSGPP
ncbi:uncharacterized protein J3R85_001218 [Psidium guajava]|nr:uncharacterized protein J3R85_001218 [Psidium guajava]